MSETTRVANLIEHVGLRAADHFGPRDQVLDGGLLARGDPAGDVVPERTLVRAHGRLQEPQALAREPA